MSMEISIDIFLSIQDIDDIFLLLAKRRWKISTIFYMYFQNDDENCHRHFPSISKFHLQGFRSNIWVINLKGLFFDNTMG